ncbi:cytochrome P450 [Micromonospora sp. M12]
MTRHADVRAALTDPAFRVPAVDSGPPGTLAWLRATVSRFSPPQRHAERRAIVRNALAPLDPDDLRDDAARLTVAVLDRAGDRVDVMRELARPVPLLALADRLGFADPAAAGTAVAVVASAYHRGGPGADHAGRPGGDGAAGARAGGHTDGTGEPDRSAGPGVRRDRRTDRCRRPPPAAPAGPRAPTTAGTADLLDEVLRLDPPVRATRRVTVETVRLGGQDLPAGSPCCCGSTRPTVMPRRFPSQRRSSPVGPVPVC